MPPYFIAIHAGAGAFSADPAREAELKAAMREACEAGAAIMCLGGGGASPDPALATLTSAIAPAPADLALAAAAAAVASLEDWPGANAGVGSSLTEAGRVECDASAMAGDGAWGGAAAARGVRHPATVAAALAAESRLAMPLGRVRPILLAGSGVRSWAAARGLGVLALADEHCRGGGGEGGGPPGALGWQVTPRTHAQWAHWSEMAAVEAAVTAAGGGCHGHLVVSGRWVAAVGGAGDAPSGEDGGGGEGAPAEQPVKRRRRLVTGTHASPPLPPPGPGGGGDGSSEDGDDDCPGDDADLTPPHDTVGAVVVCGLTGATAAAVSSGGLALKSPGRVGEAAIFGAGCWAEDGRAGGDGAAASSSPSATLPPGVVGIAASVSGVGEVIIRSGLARAAAASVAGGGVDALAGAVAAAAVAGAGVQPDAPVDCGALVVRALRSCSPGAQSTGATVVATVEAAVAAQAEGMAFAYRWEGHGGGSREEVLRSGRGRRGVQFSVSAPLAAE